MCVCVCVCVCVNMTEEKQHDIQGIIEKMKTL